MDELSVANKVEAGGVHWTEVLRLVDRSVERMSVAHSKGKFFGSKLADQYCRGTGLRLCEDKDLKDAESNLDYLNDIENLGLISLQLLRGASFEDLNRKRLLEDLESGKFENQLHAGRDIPIWFRLLLKKMIRVHATPCSLNEIRSNLAKYCGNCQLSGKSPAAIKPDPSAREIRHVSLVKDSSVTSAAIQIMRGGVVLSLLLFFILAFVAIVPFLGMHFDKVSFPNRVFWWVPAFVSLSAVLAFPFAMVIMVAHGFRSGLIAWYRAAVVFVLVMQLSYMGQVTYLTLKAAPSSSALSEIEVAPATWKTATTLTFESILHAGVFAPSAPAYSMVKDLKGAVVEHRQPAVVSQTGYYVLILTLASFLFLRFKDSVVPSGLHIVSGLLVPTLLLQQFLTVYLEVHFWEFMEVYSTLSLGSLSVTIRNWGILLGLCNVHLFILLYMWSSRIEHEESDIGRF